MFIYIYTKICAHLLIFIFHVYIYIYICIDSSLGGGCIPIPVFFQQLDDGTLLRENLQEPHEDDDDELADAPRYVGSISPLDIR